MKTTYHSEYLKLNTVFIKPANNAFVSEHILKEQWRAHNFLDQPDYKKTLTEYDFFRKALQKNGATLYNFPFNENVSIDSIYCRDASIATDFGMIICNMGKETRINEPAAQLEIFKNNAIPILGIIESPGTLEGGDVAWLDEKTLAVGHTYRTNEHGIKQLKNLLEPKGIEVLVANLPHYKGISDVFHLM